MKNKVQISIHVIDEQEKKTLLKNLSLTPEERLVNHQKALNLMRTLQDVRKVLDGPRS